MYGGVSALSRNRSSTYKGVDTDKVQARSNILDPQSMKYTAELPRNAFVQGDHLPAHGAYREALEIFAGLGHRRGIAQALEAPLVWPWLRGKANVR